MSATYPHFDGIWVHERYFYEIDEYLDWCFDEDTAPETTVEVCRITPFKMDADELIERAYEVNEVDPDEDNSVPDIDARAELQALLDGWSKKHLNNWAFPTGEKLDISAEIAAYATARPSG